MLPYLLLDDYKQPIQYLKGVGAGIAGKLKRLGIITLGDAVFHTPIRYEDRSHIQHISSLIFDKKQLYLLRVHDVRTIKLKGRRILNITASDNTGYVHLIFFNRNFLAESLKTGDYIYVYGQLKKRGQKLQIVHPDISMSDSNNTKTGIYPVYPLTDGISNRRLSRIIKQALGILPKPELLPAIIRHEGLLMGYGDAIKNLHFPTSMEAHRASKKRFAFEEFFYLQLGILFWKAKLGETTAPVIRASGALRNRLIGRLPFELTHYQVDAIDRIRTLMGGKGAMRVLLQGDVGAGKTIVALIAMLDVIESGYQAVFLVPTEVLAIQHYKKICTLFGDTVRIGLLTGGIKGKKRVGILNDLMNNRLDLIIGTHALLYDDIVIPNPGLVVIDEQHRFGVTQRGRLLEKGGNIHLMAMTATPIPRTLSLTLYGEMDVVTIRGLPGGRQPITTVIRTFDRLKRVYGFIRDEISRGHRAYLVCPLIEESESLDLNYAMGIYEGARQAFGDNVTALLHGRMPQGERDNIMERFRTGSIRVLVATTVIEVGVDVPEATVMVIYNAERFGISQLHQLRGRVGRSNRKSYCVLVTHDPENKRLIALTKTNDGFKLAEEDLRIRGAGEFLGMRQHGEMDLIFGDILRDKRLLEYARKKAREYLRIDPELKGLSPIVRGFIHEGFRNIFSRYS